MVAFRLPPASSETVSVSETRRNMADFNSWLEQNMDIINRACEKKEDEVNDDVPPQSPATSEMSGHIYTANGQADVCVRSAASNAAATLATEEDHIHRVFQLCDVDKSGHVLVSSLMDCIRNFLVNNDPDFDMLANLWRLFVADGSDALVDFDNYRRVMKEWLQYIRSSSINSSHCELESSPPSPKSFLSADDLIDFSSSTSDGAERPLTSRLHSSPVSSVQRDWPLVTAEFGSMEVLAGDNSVLDPVELIHEIQQLRHELNATREQKTKSDRQLLAADDQIIQLIKDRDDLTKRSSCNQALTDKNRSLMKECEELRESLAHSDEKYVGSRKLVAAILNDKKCLESQVKLLDEQLAFCTNHNEQLKSALEDSLALSSQQKADLEHQGESLLAANTKNECQSKEMKELKGSLAECLSIMQSLREEKIALEAQLAASDEGDLLLGRNFSTGERRLFLKSSREPMSISEPSSTVGNRFSTFSVAHRQLTPALAARDVNSQVTPLSIHAEIKHMILGSPSPFCEKNGTSFDLKWTSKRRSAVGRRQKDHRIKSLRRCSSQEQRPAQNGLEDSGSTQDEDGDNDPTNSSRQGMNRKCNRMVCVQVEARLEKRLQDLRNTLTGLTSAFAELLCSAKELYRLCLLLALPSPSAEHLSYDSALSLDDRVQIDGFEGEKIMTDGNVATSLPPELSKKLLSHVLIDEQNASVIFNHESHSEKVDVLKLYITRSLAILNGLITSRISPSGSCLNCNVSWSNWNGKTDTVAMNGAMSTSGLLWKEHYFQVHSKSARRRTLSCSDSFSLTAMMAKSTQTEVGFSEFKNPIPLTSEGVSSGVFQLRRSSFLPAVTQGSSDSNSSAVLHGRESNTSVPSERHSEFGRAVCQPTPYRNQPLTAGLPLTRCRMTYFVPTRKPTVSAHPYKRLSSNRLINVASPRPWTSWNRRPSSRAGASGTSSRPTERSGSGTEVAEASVTPSVRRNRRGSQSSTARRALLTKIQKHSPTQRPVICLETSEAVLPKRSMEPESDPLNTSVTETEVGSAFPNLVESLLLKLNDKRNSEDMSEQEIENEFQHLAVAIRADKFTMERRLELHLRQRDLAEVNVETELNFFDRGLNVGHDEAQKICFDSETSVRLIDIQRHIAVVRQAVERASSRSEVYGAIQREEKVARAVEVMMKHVDNVVRKSKILRSQLDELERCLDEANLMENGRMSRSADATPKTSFIGFSAVTGTDLRQRRTSLGQISSRANLTARNSCSCPVSPCREFQSGGPVSIFRGHSVDGYLGLTRRHLSPGISACQFVNGGQQIGPVRKLTLEDMNCLSVSDEERDVQSIPDHSNNDEDAIIPGINALVCRDLVATGDSTGNSLAVPSRICRERSSGEVVMRRWEFKGRVNKHESLCARFLRNLFGGLFFFTALVCLMTSYIGPVRIEVWNTLVEILRPYMRLTYLGSPPS